MRSTRARVHAYSDLGCTAGMHVRERAHINTDGGGGWAQKCVLASQVRGWCLGWGSENMANEAYERLMPLIEARGGQGEHDSKERAEVLRLLHLLHIPRHAAPAQTSDKAKLADGAVHARSAFSHRQVPVASRAVGVLAQDSPPAFLHLSCYTAAPAEGEQTDEAWQEDSVGVVFGGGEEKCLFRANTVNDKGAEDQEQGGSGGNEAAARLNSSCRGGPI